VATKRAHAIRLQDDEKAKLRRQLHAVRRRNTKLRGKLMAMLRLYLGDDEARAAVRTRLRPAGFDVELWEEIVALLTEE